MGFLSFISKEIALVISKISWKQWVENNEIISVISKAITYRIWQFNYAAILLSIGYEIRRLGYNGCNYYGIFNFKMLSSTTIMGMLQLT